MKKKIFDWIFLIFVCAVAIFEITIVNNVTYYISGVSIGLLLSTGILELIKDYKEK